MFHSIVRPVVISPIRSLFRSLPGVSATGTSALKLLLSQAVGYWKLDDNAASTVVTDYSGNGNHGTMRSASTEDLSFPGPNANAPLGFDFTGGQDITLPEVISTDYLSGDFSISFWAEFDTPAGNQGLMQVGASYGQNNSMQIWVSPPSTFITTFRGTVAYNPALSLPSAGWHRVTVTLDRAARAMVTYIDDAVLNSRTLATTEVPVFASSVFYIAYFSLGRFVGGMSDWAIFDRVLTSEEVALLSGLTINPSPVDGYANANGDFYKAPSGDFYTQPV